MKEIILATLNPGKIAELSAILPSIHCIPQAQLGIPPAEEVGLSFIENAILKARHASRFGNRPALADDSGLVVDALGGEPGLFSARFAAPCGSEHANRALLLEKMAQVPDSERQAYFYCALALTQHAHDPAPLIATGKLSGKIAKAPSGTGGFGYDAIFWIDSLSCTVAQLSAETKNAISHRAVALRDLCAQLLLE